MTWHLKDKEFERKLIEFCPKFLDELNESAYVSVGYTKYVPVILDREDPDGNLKKITLFFWLDELEELEAYNPHDWNKFPAVTPPENIPMRVETESGGYIYRECAIFNEGVWKCERDGEADEELYGHVKRFRPWSED